MSFARECKERSHSRLKGLEVPSGTSFIEEQASGEGETVEGRTQYMR